MLHYGVSVAGDYKYVYDTRSDRVKRFNVVNKPVDDVPLTPDILPRLSLCSSILLVDCMAKCKLRLEDERGVYEQTFNKPLMVLYNYLSTVLGYSLRFKLQSFAEVQGVKVNTFLLLVSCDVDIRKLLAEVGC